MKYVPWLDLSYKQIGIREITGDQHNYKILAYHLETTLKATSDEVPWCSAFVCAMFEWSDIPSTRSAMARSWNDWGLELDLPKIGCVVVLSRDAAGPKAGHVGFYVGESSTHIKLLSGNIDDSVCVNSFRKTRVLSYRWPDPDQWRDKIEVDSDISNAH